MKFVIETIGLTAGGGMELALDLMRNLAGHTEHQFTFIVPDLAPYKATSGGNIRTIVCKGGPGLLHRARLLNYEVPKISRKEGANALLCLGNFVPWKRVCPTVVLLHNPWIVCRDTVAQSRLALRENLITAYGRQAYHHLPGDVRIITQTQVMKDQLCERYRINPERVAIVPNTYSVAKPAGSRDRAPSDGNGNAIPFTFFCLAHYYAHKNIEILVEAAGKLPKYTGKAAKCVVTIAPEQHPGARRLLERLNRGEAAGKVENIGPVPSEMLPQVYANADALIFPTLLESFSRTYLEAMHFGIPILTSDRDFAHHLCRDAAFYFDPLDADSVAQAMAGMIEDADLRQRLVENGRRVLEQVPTWDEIATGFVEVLERAAEGQIPINAVLEHQRANNYVPFSPGWQAPREAPSAAKGLLPLGSQTPQARGHASLSGKGESEASTVDDVRKLFNQKARRWQSKYGQGGKLNFRLQQFKGRLSALFLPPGNILDLGCGTGEIATAISHMGYHITACDVAEEMIDVARSSHPGSAVEWVRLEPDWEVLPFADSSFDGIVASSVFEYLNDVPRVATELSRVLRPEGVLLLTVPNPCNFVRKLEAWLQWMHLVQQLSSVLRRVQRIDSYAAYLRLSRNRFEASGWQSLLSAAHFAALDERDFTQEAWLHQARAPLVLLAVKRVATGGSGQFDAEETLCRPLAI